MLTDRRRPWTAAICVLGLVACFAGWAYLQQSGAMGYGAFEAHPEQFDGKDVSLSLVRVASIGGPQDYSVEKGTLRIQVRGPSAGLQPGEDISVGGVWRASEPFLEQRWIERREAGRRAKRVLGFIGLGTVLGILLLRVRLTRSGLVVLG